jgi:hypothetical protein
VVLSSSVGNNTFSNVIVNSNYVGISMSYYADNNTFSNITLNSNTYEGMDISTFSSNNTFSNVILNSNGDYGIILSLSADNNTFSNMTLESSGVGIYMDSCSNNRLVSSRVCNNNLLNFNCTIDEDTGVASTFSGSGNSCSPASVCGINCVAC